MPRKRQQANIHAASQAERKFQKLYMDLSQKDLANLRVLQRHSVSRHRAPSIRACIAQVAQLIRHMEREAKEDRRLVLISVPIMDGPPEGMKVLIDDLNPLV